MNIDLRGLRFFVAVAEQGSVGKAAEQLHMAQPPLSAQIRRLEDRLGTALFIRHPTGMQLTEAGKVLFPRAREAIALARDGVAAARAIASGERGQLVVGYMFSLGYGLLPGLIPLLRKRLPGVELQFIEMNAKTSEPYLIERKVDIGICMPPVKHGSVATVPVGRQNLRLAMRSSDPLARHARIDVRQLEGRPLIALPTMAESAESGPAARLLRRNQVTVRIVDRVDTVHAALALVMACEGVAIVPACTRMGLPKGVVLRPFDDDDEGFEVAVCLRIDAENQLLDPFVSCVQDAFRKMAAQL